MAHQLSLLPSPSLLRHFLATRSSSTLIWCWQTKQAHTAADRTGVLTAWTCRNSRGLHSPGSFDTIMLFLFVMYSLIEYGWLTDAWKFYIQKLSNLAAASHWQNTHLNSSKRLLLTYHYIIWANFNIKIKKLFWTVLWNFPFSKGEVNGFRMAQRNGSKPAI